MEMVSIWIGYSIQIMDTFPCIQNGLVCDQITLCDRKQPQINAPPVGPEQRAENDDDDQELVQVLNDVEEMFGQPFFFT